MDIEKDMSSATSIDCIEDLDCDTESCHNIKEATGHIINEDCDSLQEPMHTDFLPKIGMTFDSEDDALQFYNEYARRTGFGTRKDVYYRHRYTGVITNRVFCCAKEGHRRTDKRDKMVVKHRAETRTGCMARIKIMLDSKGKYKIAHFEDKHNHELLLSSMVHMLRSHKKSTKAQAAETDIANSTGIQPKTTIEMMRKEAGSIEYLGFMRAGCSNYLQSKRMMAMRKGDAGALLEYFQRKQSEDPSFFYAIQLDNEDLISNIFWTDACMMADYSYFSDVVCFDTTCRTNKASRPFGIFVGVNHHRQIKIFGAALIYDESISTFYWLFETFVKAMSGKRPKTILTDHDPAITRAIALVLPDTHHRFCVWHMFQNAAKHLNDVFNHEKSFAKDFSRCIYEYEDEDEFIEAWNTMINKYDLSSNTWLRSKFDEKEKWALAYGRNTFCANISTTQRSESMNSSLKTHLHNQKDLLQFLGRFDKLLYDRRYEELKADCKMMNSTPALLERNQMLEHAKTVYTEEIFELVYKEVMGILNCDLQICEEVGTVIEYKVTSDSTPRPREHIVIFDRFSVTVNCSCNKFEFAGILCSHALYILRFNKIKKIPDAYILKRWTKDAKSGFIAYKQVQVIENDPKVAIGIRFKDLCGTFVQTARKAALHEESFDFTIDLIKQIECRVDRILKEKNTGRGMGEPSQKEGFLTHGWQHSTREQTSKSDYEERGTYMEALFH